MASSVFKTYKNSIYPENQTRFFRFRITRVQISETTEATKAFKPIYMEGNKREEKDPRPTGICYPGVSYPRR